MLNMYDYMTEQTSRDQPVNNHCFKANCAAETYTEVSRQHNNRDSNPGIGWGGPLLHLQRENKPKRSVFLIKLTQKALQEVLKSQVARKGEEKHWMMKLNFSPCSPDKRQEAELSSRP